MEAKLQRTRELHDTLLPVMAELIGDCLKVEKSVNADAGLVLYGFSGGDVHTLVEITPHSENAAAVCFQARVGRCYVQYPRALRWLVSNRAGNSVAVNAGPDEMRRRELSVYTNRVTMPGDAEGLREAILDFGMEVARVKAGMAWFPQLLQGEQLTNMEQIDDEGMREWCLAVLASPSAFIEWVEENEADALENNGTFPMNVYGWLNRWDGKLRWMEKHWKTLTGEEQNEKQLGYLVERMHTVARLGRYEEALFMADEIAPRLDEENLVGMDGYRMAILCGLGRHEEALELTRSAEFDDNLRICYWRAFAAASLQRFDEAADHYGHYERRMGPDIIARKKVLGLFPDGWQPAGTEDETEAA